MSSPGAGYFLQRLMRNLLNNNRANIASRIYALKAADSLLMDAEYLAELARSSLVAADIFIAEADAQEPEAGCADEPASDRAKSWWCTGCKDFVSPEDVTFDETHDTLRGGCGGECK